MSWVNAVIQGILLGGFYALLACGLSLMFGVMRIINLAHGDIAVLGAYLIWEVAHTLNISPFLALLPVLPVMVAFGYLLQRYLADFGASYLILLGTLGIVVMLFAPKGLWGLITERYDLALFPTRRRLVIPPRAEIVSKTQG